ncbi:MAG: helix-hairpin-helix domain-containing protein [Rhodospirillales bacterium]
MNRRRAGALNRYGNLFDAIEARREVGFDRFLLRIFQIGAATARLLARNYPALDDLRRALAAAADPESEERKALLNIDQIGPSAADELIRFFADKRNAAVVDDWPGN